jgi:hypothetical protein
VHCLFLAADHELGFRYPPIPVPDQSFTRHELAALIRSSRRRAPGASREIDTKRFGSLQIEDREVAVHERVKWKRPARVLAGSKGEQEGEKTQTFHSSVLAHSITSCRRRDFAPASPVRPAWLSARPCAACARPAAHAQSVATPPPHRPEA